MEGTLSFLLHTQKNLPWFTTSSGSPVASLIFTETGPSKNARHATQTAPGGNQTGEHASE